MNRTIKYSINEGIPITFLLIYFVGLVLYFMPLTQYLFTLITPYSLVLVTVLIFLHHIEWNTKTIAVLASIFVIGFVTEIIGVATGSLFGEYEYGNGLGIKVADVPLVIGLNWIFLVYASNGIVSKYTSNNILIVLGAASLMVVYDIVLEKAAPLMDMWEFSENNPPVNNYIMWFVLALLFNILLQVFKVKTNNTPARWLFFIQFVFFCIIVSHSLFF